MDKCRPLYKMMMIMVIILVVAVVDGVCVIYNVLGISSL